MTGQIVNSEKSNTEKIVEGLERNPGLRLVLGMVPYASGVLETFIAHAKNLQENRLVHFFNCLEADGLVLTEDMVKSDDFLHRCIITMRAAARTRRQEKIELLATALSNSAHINCDDDKYESLLGIIDEVQFKEFQALQLLENFEKHHPAEPSENRLQRATKFWKMYLGELESKLGVQKAEARDFLKRIERTGCYSEITGTYYDYQGGVGYLTQTYFEVKEICNAKG